jgi:DNA-binding NtrC family response regulator
MVVNKALKNARILIIDDDEGMRKLLEKFVLNYCSHVYSFANGLDAMQWIMQRNVPSLILTDISMPNLDGIQLLKNISQSGIYQDIPVIVISSLAKNSGCIEQGAYAYLEKPFNPIILLETMQAALSSSEAEETLVTT